MANDPDWLPASTESWKNDLVAVVHLALGLAGALAVFFIAVQSRQNLIFTVLLAGSSGFTTGVLTPLFTGIVWSTSRRPQIRGSNSILGPTIYAVLGFGGAVGATTLSYALLGGTTVLSGSGFSTSPVTSDDFAGPAAFGGLVGIAVGRILVAVFSQSREAASEDKPELPIIGALTRVEKNLYQRYLSPEIANYDGYVISGWYPTDSRSREEESPQGRPDREKYVLGNIRLVLQPRLKQPNKSSLALLNDDQDDGPPATQSRARILTQGGKEADEAFFSVSVLATGYQVFPSQAILRAPVRDRSAVIQFTVTTPIGRALDSPESAGPPPPQSPTFLIDISQAGNTVQVLELDTWFQEGERR